MNLQQALENLETRKRKLSDEDYKELLKKIENSQDDRIKVIKWEMPYKFAKMYFERKYDIECNFELKFAEDSSVKQSIIEQHKQIPSSDTIKAIKLGDQWTITGFDDKKAFKVETLDVKLDKKLLEKLKEYDPEDPEDDDIDIIQLCAQKIVRTVKDGKIKDVIREVLDSAKLIMEVETQTDGSIRGKNLSITKPVDIDGDKVYKDGIHKLYYELDDRFIKKEKGLLKSLLKCYINFVIINEGLQTDGWIRNEYLSENNQNRKNFPLVYFFSFYSVCDRKYIKEYFDSETMAKKYIKKARSLGIINFKNINNYLQLQHLIHEYGDKELIGEYWKTVVQALFQVSNSLNKNILLNVSGHLAELVRIQSILQLHSDPSKGGIRHYYDVKGINREVANTLRGTDIDILVKDKYSTNEFWLEVKDAEKSYDGRIQSQIVGMSMFLRQNVKDDLYNFYEQEKQQKGLRTKIIQALFFSWKYKDLLKKFETIKDEWLEEAFKIIATIIRKNQLFKDYSSKQKFKKLLTAHENFNQASRYNIQYIIDCYKELMGKKHLTEIGLKPYEINELFEFFGDQPISSSKYDTKNIGSYVFLNYQSMKEKGLVDFTKAWFEDYLLKTPGWQIKSLGKSNEHIIYNIIFYHTNQKTKKKIVFARNVGSVQGNFIISFLNSLNYMDDSAFNDPIITLGSIIESQGLKDELNLKISIQDDQAIQFLEIILGLKKKDINDNLVVDEDRIIEFTRYLCDFCYYMSTQGGNNQKTAKDNLKMLLEDYSKYISENVTLIMDDGEKKSFFKNQFEDDIESGFTADIRCCDNCYDEALVKYPSLKGNEEFQQSSILLSDFLSGSPRINYFFSEDDMKKYIETILCPNCNKPLTWDKNIWAYNVEEDEG
ncbi:MAG: hypothetical protein H7A23_15295 [Leptospiraceae bacterium]|nr:hypothetical protein [Leptospiraceae bacterium]